MNTYSTSWGERFTTDQINRKSDRVAKELLQEQKDELGYNVCTECKRNDCVPIQVAHIESRKKLKEEGRVEMIWSLSNLKILGQPCHRKLDGLTLW